MPGQPDFFRDFGILPYGIVDPPETVRASFSLSQRIGQYLATILMSGFGIGLGMLCAFNLSFPANLLALQVPFFGFGCFVYYATRNDYAWIELNGEKLRAQHLYTGRIVERPIEEIEDLLTLVFSSRTAAAFITEAWLGRVRGIMIRFHDQRTPLQVSRVDPTMRNAKELIEAIISRMSEKGKVDAEVIDFEGQPLIRRIYWKVPDQTRV